MFLPIWGIVAVVMFACFSYSIGRGSTANAADNAENDDTGGIFFIAFCISFLWPIVLALLTVFGPFYFLYKMGVNKTKKEAEKKQVWDTLKK